MQMAISAFEVNPADAIAPLKEAIRLDPYMLRPSTVSALCTHGWGSSWRQFDRFGRHSR